MARGKQLQQLVYKLRARAGHSVLVSSGIDNLPVLKELIASTQEVLYDDYDWPFMIYKPFKQLNAGQRYYDMPTDMNLEAIEAVYIWDGDTCTGRLERGINPVDMNSTNSELGGRSGPVVKWDIVWSGTAPQIEVWPIPGDQSARLQIVGKRKLPDLIADSDIAVLDDQLIVLTCAAEILLDAESPRAKAVQMKAEARYNRLRGNLKAGTRPMVLNGSGSQPRGRTGHVTIRIGR